MDTSRGAGPPAGPGAQGSSAGARWTAGLGAFLLVAAAATFVAVRWEQIPDGAKFGALVAVTVACLGAGARLRAPLPITASALLHLGVLLVPIDVAALGARAGWEWPRMLLALGLTATAAFGAGAYLERSVVLRWATWGAVVALAGGVGAVGGLPAAPLLAATGLAAVAVAQRSRLGRSLEVGGAAWAALAGYATPLAMADTGRLPFDRTLTALGLVGDGSPAGTAWATGLASALALGLVGARRRHPAPVLVGVGAALVGALTTWATLDLDDGSDLLALAGLALAAQLAHRGFRADPFWRRVTSVIAEAAMVPIIPATVVLAGFVLLTPTLDDALPSPVEGLAAALVATTWLVTATRHVGRRSLTAAAASGAAAVVLLAGAHEVTGPLALTALAVAALLLAPRWSGPNLAGDQVTAAALLALVPLSAYEHDGLAVAVGVAGALALAEAAVQASRRPAAARTAPPPPTATPTGTPAPGGPWAPPGSVVGPPRPAPWLAPPVPGRRPGGSAWAWALWALVPPGAAALLLTEEDQWLGRSLGLVVIGWLLALVLDRAEQEPGREPVAVVARAAMVAALLTTPGLTSTAAAATAGLAAGLLLLDALRRPEPALVVGVGVALPMAVAHLALATGWTVPAASVVVTGSALVWLGLAGCLPGRWAPPALVSAVIAAGAGLVLGAGDGVVFSADLLLIGVGVALAGLVVGELDVALAGGGIATVGTWGLLTAYDVSAADAYVAPVAALLLAVGLVARRGDGAGLSSWLALAPAIALLGGTALVERVAGGSSWHAAVAGGVGVAAVTAGAAGRWGGPLLTGTALVVAVTVHETLGVTAALPTWVWLAAGGVALLAAGVAMERRGVGPVETGRRLVDVIGERFD